MRHVAEGVSLLRLRETGMQGVRRALALVAVGSVAFVASGCLGSSGGSSNKGTTAAGKDTVEVMYGFGQQQEVAFKKDVEKFAAANGFKVKFTKAGSWDTEIRARVAGGSPPDVGLF